MTRSQRINKTVLGLCTLAYFFLGELQAQTWSSKQNIPAGQKIDEGLCFEANGNIFMGGGINSSKIFEYDIAADLWAEKTKVPGPIISYREGGVSFNIGGKAFVGLGVDMNPATFTEIYLKDLWEYNAAANTWSRKSDLPATGRSGATVFVVNGKAYVAGGNVGAGYLNDLWEYDPATNKWTEKSKMFMGSAFAAGFSLNNKGYIVFGTEVDPVTFKLGETNKLYEYDPATNTWAKKSAYPGAARGWPVAFVLNNSVAYAGTGRNFAFKIFSDLYAYHPSSDTWTAAPDFPTGGRLGMSAVTVGNKAYCGNGRSMANFNYIHHNEWFEVEHPNSVGLQQVSDEEISIYPVPSGSELTIRLLERAISKEVQFTLLNSTGQVILEGRMPGPLFTIDTRAIPEGLYHLTVGAGESRCHRQIVIQH